MNAQEYLKEESTLDLTDSKTIADPFDNHVWKVTTPNDPNWAFAIVYLNHREYGNDFEVSE